jgi:hypothetical protein
MMVCRWRLGVSSWGRFAPQQSWKWTWFTKFRPIAMRMQSSWNCFQRLFKPSTTRMFWQRTLSSLGSERAQILRAGMCSKTKLVLEDEQLCRKWVWSLKFWTQVLTWQRPYHCMFSLEKLLDVRLLMLFNPLLSFGFCVVSFPPFFSWLLRVLLCCQMSNIQNLIIWSPLNSFQAELIVSIEEISMIMNIIVGGSSSLFWFCVYGVLLRRWVLWQSADRHLWRGWSHLWSGWRRQKRKTSDPLASGRFKGASLCKDFLQL